MKKKEGNEEQSSLVSSCSDEDKDLTGKLMKLKKQTVKERIYGLNGFAVKKGTQYF